MLMFLFLLEAGDIESIPGPVNKHSLSILYLNIRSIRNKISYIQDYLSDFNIVCFLGLTSIKMFRLICIVLRIIVVPL